MASFVRRKYFLAILPFLEPENLYDRVDQNDLLRNPNEMTGFERLKNLFEPYEGHPVHPSIAGIVTTSLGSLLGGGIIGAIKSSRETFISFIENNEATQFRSHLDAKRTLSDKMFLSFGRGFLSLGPRVCLFCTTFTTTQILLTTYQNKYSFLHHTAAGMTAGALYKIPFGFQGMCSGAIFGSLFGSTFGLLHALVLKLSDLSHEELTKYKNSKSFKREEDIVKAQKDIQLADEKEEVLLLLQESILNKKR